MQSLYADSIVISIRPHQRQSSISGHHVSDLTNYSIFSSCSWHYCDLQDSLNSMKKMWGIFARNSLL